MRRLISINKVKIIVLSFIVAACIAGIGGIVTGHIVQASVQINSSSTNKMLHTTMKDEKSKEVLSTKYSIISEIKLNTGEQILSVEQKTWGEYISSKGESADKSAISDDRMIWVVTVDCPEGVQTRGGLFRNAVKTYVFDAFTENLIVMDIQGQRDKKVFHRQVKIK